MKKTLNLHVSTRLPAAPQYTGVVASKFLEVRRIFARISPNLPEKFCCVTFAFKFFPTTIMKTLFLVWTPKKGLHLFFPQTLGAIF